MSPPPLVMHVLYRFATGGLENGVVNLINHMPPGRFRHAVVALDTVDPAFAARLSRPDVPCIALGKPPGHAFRVFPGFLRLVRDLRPAIVHTRNLAALEMQLPAAWARVPVRLHGEHGWDSADPQGRDGRQRLIRRLYSPFVHRYVTLSEELQQYLCRRVGIGADRIERLCNGVDTGRFSPPPDGPEPLPGCPFDPRAHWIVGTVGRLQTVKNQTLLVRAFAQALSTTPELRDRARLAIVGDGPLRSAVEGVIAEAGMGGHVWLAGERRDVPEVMRAMHLFVLPSQAEGISNTILEAMACGLPVLATRVGGNPELVADGETGTLVPSDDVDAMAMALVRLYRGHETTARWGRQARLAAEQRFSLRTMVDGYAGVYERELNRRRR